MNDFFFSLAHFAVSIYPVLYVFTLLVGSVFVISGFTDFTFDLYFIFHSIRRFFLSRNWPKLTLMRLQSREQQKIAICIACWHEADVIAQTLSNAVNNIQYRNYDIFVGTYPNDPKTQAQVDLVAKKNPHVHKVISPFPGPTTKPSNLNSIYQAIKDYEKKVGFTYEIIMTHDAEDLIHPYSLLVVNYLIPRKDMIQLPVFPLEVPWYEFTHWSYADEFAENHTKLLLVRELTGGFVPAAGVGAAFTRRCFEWFNAHEVQPFSTNTLTEDYELGLRLHLEGFQAAFVLVNLPPPENHKERNKRSMQWVATRAYFPRNFWSAVRQKTRWNIGIVLQAWRNLGWRGDRVTQWNLLLDRKVLVSTPANFLSYFVFLYFIFYQILLHSYSGFMPPLIVQGTLLWYIISIATFFMVWRMINRSYAVQKIYGFWPAVLSIPRSVWGNVINFFAIIRAVVQYAHHLASGESLTWDKTAHQVPIGEVGIQSESDVMGKPLGESNQPLPEKEKQEKINATIEKFHKNIKSKNEDERVEAIHAINRDTGRLVFPELKKLIKDPSWRIRAEVCTTLSFLRLPEALPLLEKAATDPDWVVRSNAVRAIGKLGALGEESLLRILQCNDRYACEAALAILEQQGFLDKYVQYISSEDSEKVHTGIRFLQTMDQYGHSRLARAALEKIKKDAHVHN